MIKIVDLDTVIVNGVSQDLVSAIANNLNGDLAGILTALKVWDKSRSGEVNEAKAEESQKLIENERQSWQQQIVDRDTKIAQLKTKLSPDIASITPALLEAGLLAWGQDAVSAVDSDKGAAIMGLVMDLKMVAIESPSITQCDRIKQLFGAIGTMSGVWPTSAQATAMQAVLDVGPASTGPVGSDYLDFHKFI